MALLKLENSGSTAKIARHAEKPPEIYLGRCDGVNIDIWLNRLDAYTDLHMLMLYGQ